MQKSVAHYLRVAQRDFPLAKAFLYTNDDAIVNYWNIENQLNCSSIYIPNTREFVDPLYKKAFQFDVNGSKSRIKDPIRWNILHEFGGRKECRAAYRQLQK